MSFAPREQARQACAGPFHHSREQQRNRLELRCRPQGFSRPRQPRFQILREQGDEPAGDILDQVRPAELRQRSGQSIADVELDSRGLRIDRQQSITNDALRRRAASPVLAAASYRPGASLRIAVDLGQTVKFSGDRANLDAHLAGDGARVDISGYRRSGKASGDRGHVREEAPHVVERVMELTDGLGADVAIEAVGVPETFELCTDLVRPGGRVANVGVHGHPATLHLERLWIRDVTITTGLVDTFTTPRLLELISKGRLDATPFATHRFPLGETMAAYDTFADAAATNALKVVLEADPIGRRQPEEEEALVGQST